jgi:hypothetical protein
MAKLKEIKRVANAVLLSDGTNEFIRLDKVRLSFPAIGTPEPEEDDDGNPRLDAKGKQKMRWKGVAMLPQGTHKEAMLLCKEVIERLMKTNDVKIPKDKWFIVNGNDSEREEYQEHFIVSFGESRRPPARDRQGSLILEVDEIDSTFYAGCWVNVLIRPWYFAGTVKGSKKSYPKRIPAGFSGIQFFKDDTSFGGGRIDDEDAWDTDNSDGGDGMGDDEDNDEL